MQETTRADMATLVTGAFSGAFVRKRAATGYRLGMLLVLLALVILPLLYLALIAGVGWLLMWHVQHDGVWIQHASGWGTNHKGETLALILYLAVALAGVICIVFMIKPLFAPMPKKAAPVTLDPISEPAVFALIYHLCDVMGAPRPVAVVVDSQVNASASFRRGMESFFSQDLVLCIGMPLVAGMTVRQLVAVLAHEFGHFSQGSGMRLDYLVNSINLWFARAVLERDEWDERLDRFAGMNGYAGIAGLCARTSVWMGRKVLSILMHAGGVISGFMSRQMEHDADAYAAQVAGSREFAGALLQLELLGEAESAVQKKMWALRALPDNLPGCIASHVRGMPEDARQKLHNRSLAQKASWWSTHPAMKERIAKVNAAAARGLFHLDAPAADLFLNFKDLCKTVSLYWYDVKLALDLDAHKLVDFEHMDQPYAEQQQLRAQQVEDQRVVGQLVDEQFRKERLRDEAVKEMFGQQPPPYRLIAVPMATPEQWAPAEAMVKAWKAGYAPACEREKQQRDRLCNRTLACHLLHLGHELASLEALGTDARSAATVMAAQVEALHEHETTAKQLALFEQAAWTRVTAILAWHFQQTNTPQAWQQQVGALVEAQRTLAAAMQSLLAVWVDAMLVGHASLSAKAGPATSVPMTILYEYDARVQAALQNIMRNLEAAGNPYAQEMQRLSASFSVPSPSNLHGFYSLESYPALRNDIYLYAIRVTRDLCLLAYEVEEAWGSALPLRPAPQTAPQSVWQAAALSVAA